jgi:hypothetical protein
VAQTIATTKITTKLLIEKRATGISPVSATSIPQYRHVYYGVAGHDKMT